MKLSGASPASPVDDKTWSQLKEMGEKHGFGDAFAA